MSQVLGEYEKDTFTAWTWSHCICHCSERQAGRLGRLGCSMYSPMPKCNKGGQILFLDKFITHLTLLCSISIEGFELQKSNPFIDLNKFNQHTQVIPPPTIRLQLENRYLCMYLCIYVSMYVSMYLCLYVNIIIIYNYYL